MTMTDQTGKQGSSHQEDGRRGPDQQQFSGVLPAPFHRCAGRKCRPPLPVAVGIHPAPAGVAITLG
jgi:hypothetical protein